ncbi:hypothetical protein [Ramlibacter tataouinensis]|uniref:Uncharacterized protein n=1 Tax=Ramlibacter tataouinensis (strain ATCC BAA-407 / DSM 14655 / LMG 21543 / TTB310) TaxID=365046 RepID=F5Y5X5_RAMTT|nr:hypothetical protein [Ramlibacter tataouinensis]AEG91479.1 Hypothetical protein Rta_04080 [Ramlibacter tataouinensis TTB310]
MKRTIALLLMAACLAPVQAAAQTKVRTCPRAAELKPEQLLGRWRAEFEGLAQGATVLLERNPRWEGRFSGTVNRNGARSEVAGDVEDGEFTMEESADGTRISATWLGEVVEGSCGREIRGTWEAEGTELARPFVLRRTAPR